MKIIVRLLILCLVLILGTAALGPMIASTDWGKSVFFVLAKSATGYRMQADMLHLSWLDSQEIAGLQVFDKNGKEIFSCDDMRSDAGLWQIAVRKDLGNTSLKAPKAVIETGMGKIAAVSRQAGFSPAVAFNGIPISAYAGNVKVQGGQVAFLTDGLDPIVFQEIEADLQMAVQRAASVSLSGVTVQGSQKGSFDIQGKWDGKELSFNANAASFPVRGLDQIAALSQPKMRGLLLEGIGASLDFSLSLQCSESSVAASLDAKSPLFSASLKTATAQEIVTLAAPAVFQFRGTPAFVQKIAGFTPSQGVDASLQISSLRMPLADREAFSFQAVFACSRIGEIEPFSLSVSSDNFKEGQLTATLKSPQLSMTGAIFSLKEGSVLQKPVVLSGIVEGTLSALTVPQDWEKSTLEGSFTFKLPELAEPLQAKVSANTLENISLRLENKMGYADLVGALRDKASKFVLKQPATGSLALAQLPAPLPPLFDSPATLSFRIEPFSAPLSGGLKNLSLQGKVETAHLPIRETPVQNFSAAFQMKGMTGSAQLKGSVGSGSMNISAALQPEMAVTASGSLQNIPTRFFEVVSGTDRLVSTMGPSITGSFDGLSTQTEQTLSLKCDTSLLQANLSLKASDGAVRLLKPGSVSYTLTPEAYAAWNPQSPFVLKSSANMKLSLSAMTWPAAIGPNTIPSLVFDPAKVQMQGSLAVPEISFADKTIGTTASLTGLSATLKQQGEALVFDLTAGAKPQGTIKAHGSYSHAAQGIALNADISQFPTAALDMLTQNQWSLAALFGPVLNASSALQLQNLSGPVKLSINSPSSRASLDGKLANGVLFLNDTLHAQLAMTPEVSRLILKDANPLSITAIRAGAPLTIEVPARGFMLPVHPVVKSQIQVPNMRIELGQIYCENRGNLSTTLGLLKLGDLSKEKTLKLWFTPIDLQIKNGIVDCERTDILVADAYHICTWGKVDLVKDYVDMVLGLTASCLQKAFGVKGLPEDYVLQIPMRGPAGKVEIETGGATAKVTALLLWQQRSLAGSFGGGAAGTIFGKVLEGIGSLPDIDAKAPPPKRPFPWEKSGSGEPRSKRKKTSEAEEKKKKAFRADEKPLKQILKMLR